VKGLIGFLEKMRYIQPPHFVSSASRFCTIAESFDRVKIYLEAGKSHHGSYLN
jgi:hypothetical protein